MKTITNKFKIALAAVGLFAVGTVSAQTQPAPTTGDVNIAKNNNALPGTVNTSVKVIDNKGTIKYLQSNNGITTITSTSSGNRTTTTWQLGGQLTDNTYIDANGQVFALDGIKLINPTSGDAADSAATTAVTESDGDRTTVGGGYTFLVRDEKTGETKKLLASDLVVGGQFDNDIAADSGTATTVAFPVVGLPAKPDNVFVFRNGAKLVLGRDYNVTAGNVELLPKPTATDNSYWELYTGDVIEVQWTN